MAPMIGEYDTTLTRHILESFVNAAQIACTWTCCAGATRTTSSRPVQGAGPGLRDAVALDPRETGVPSTKGTLGDAMSSQGRRPRLRVGQPALGRARGGTGRRKRHGDRRPRRRGERRRPGGPRRRRVRGLHGRAARGARPGDHRAPAGRRPTGARASASACRCCSTRGVEHGVTTAGCAQWPGVVERLHAAGAAAHGLEHRRRAERHARCSRASRTSGSTSCTPTPSGVGVDGRGASAAGGHLGRARRTVRRRSGERRRCAPPSSTRRSPVTPARPCCRTG